MKLTHSSFFGGGNALTLHAAFDLATPEEPSSTLSHSLLPAKDEEDVPPLASEKKKKWKPTGSSVGRIFRSDGTAAGGKTVTVSKEEWDEVKASQARMEDMLQKVLTITAAAK